MEEMINENTFNYENYTKQQLMCLISRHEDTLVEILKDKKEVENKLWLMYLALGKTLNKE